MELSGPRMQVLVFHFTCFVAFADFHFVFSFACVLPLYSVVVFSCGRVLSEMHPKRCGKNEVRWICEETIFCVRCSLK